MQDSRSTFRRGRRLTAAALSTAVCLGWFLYLNRDGCWLYWRGARALVIFAFPWTWLTLLFGLRMRGRIVLVACSIIAALFWPHVDVVHVAAAEASAGGRVRSLQVALDAAKHEHGKYPDTLPQVSGTYPVEQYYLFQYSPVRSTSGTVTDYTVEASPLGRARYCGCIRNFTGDSRGQIHYTLQNRIATVSDPLLPKFQE